MNIIKAGDFQIGRLEDAALSPKDRAALSAMANEETAEELADMLAEADSLAEPAVLFGVCPVETRESVRIGELPVDVPLVEEKLRGKIPVLSLCGHLRRCAGELVPAVQGRLSHGILGGGD